MSSIKLQGSTSGEITVTVPSVAGTNTLTLPAATGNILTDGAVANNGIYLGGTAAANLLDDYEEGTWTPAITFGGNAVGVSYGAQIGKYVKTGNAVTVQCYLNISNKGSSTGSAKITGLPFIGTSYSFSYQGCAVAHWSLINTLSFVAVYFNPGDSQLTISGGAPPNSTNTGLDHTYFNNGTYFLFALTYITD